MILQISMAAKEPIYPTNNNLPNNKMKGPKGAIYTVPDRPPRKPVANASSAASAPVSPKTSLSGIHRLKQSSNTEANDEDEDDDEDEDHAEDDEDENEDEDDDDATYEEANEVPAPVNKTPPPLVFPSNGRSIAASATADVSQPDYGTADDVLKPSNSKKGKVKKSAVAAQVSSVSNKTYNDMDAYYGYLTSTKFLNKTQITDYLVWCGMVHSLNQPLARDMIKYKQKIAIKAIKLANEIVPIKKQNLMSFKDLPNMRTHAYCNSIFLEFDTLTNPLITPVDYTNRDFSMSFYNSLFMHMIKKNALNQASFNSICSDLLDRISKNTNFYPVFEFYNTNIGFKPQNMFDVVDFLKMMIGRCADIVYTTTRGSLDDKDKFTRIGKFPQNECLMALASLGYEVALYIDIEKVKCVRIYKPVNVSIGKKIEHINFHINNLGVFSYF